MSKTITATGVRIGNIRLVQTDGAVTGLEVTTEVNYGTFGRDETVDLWADLTATQRTMLQAIADKVVSKIQQIYLA